MVADSLRLLKAERVTPLWGDRPITSERAAPLWADRPFTGDRVTSLWADRPVGREEEEVAYAEAYEEERGQPLFFGPGNEQKDQG